jgi:lysophospholipase L1-like esterase
MADRLVSVDSSTLQFPDAVRQRIASNLGDPAQAEGAAVLGAIAAAGAGLHPIDLLLSRNLEADRADQFYRATATFRRAVARRDTAAATLWSIGDSNTLGVSPANTLTRWGSGLRDNLRAQLPVAGDPPGGFGFMSANSALNPSVVTTGGVPMAQTTAAFSPDSYAWRAYVSGDKQVYTITGTGADVLYVHLPSSGGAAVYWKVDGGASTVVPTDGAYVGPERIQIRGLASGVHTIEVGWSAGTVYSLICGVVAYDGDENKGFRSLVGGIAGGQAGTWDAMGTGPFETAKLYPPDLVILANGTNDAMGNSPVSPATFKANTLSIITKIKARTAGKVPSFVILFPTEVYKAAPLAPLADYRTAVNEIIAADPLNVTIFDLGQRINPVPTFGSTLDGLLHTDFVHFTAKGHAAIASMLARALIVGK